MVLLAHGNRANEKRTAVTASTNVGPMQSPDCPSEMAGGLICNLPLGHPGNMHHDYLEHMYWCWDLDSLKMTLSPECPEQVGHHDSSRITAMPMEQLLTLTADRLRGESLALSLPRINVSSDYYQRIKERMRLIGINISPLYVKNGCIRDGVHRARLSFDLGHEYVLVTDIPYLSGHHGEVL